MGLYRKIFAALFILMLLAGSAYNVYMELEPLDTEITALGIPETADEIQGYTAQIDSILTRHLTGGYLWNEVYGATYKAMGKKEENNFKYILDKDGQLYTGNFWNTMNITPQKLAVRVRKLQDAYGKQGTKVMVLMFPTKYDEAWSNGYYGEPYNNLNAHGTELLKYLRKYNIDYIDFRDYFYHQKGVTANDIFYKTDHHWTIPVAFDVAGEVVKHMKEVFDEDLDPDNYYMNRENYTAETYADMYMGSKGRETGVMFGGADDFTYLYPNFKTHYRYSYRSSGSGTLREEEGSMDNLLISRIGLDQEDIYEREMYASYIDGIRLTDDIVNMNNKTAPSVFCIRDSYMSPVAVFLSPVFSQLTMCWGINVTEESVMYALDKQTYDYIFIAMTEDSMSSEGFPFFIEEEENEEISAAAAAAAPNVQ